MLLGTMLVSILLARVQLGQQYRHAQASLEACQMLDGLLRAWWADADNFPRAGKGSVPGHPGWRWQVRTLKRDDADALYSQVIAVELFAPNQPGTTPAAGVELLLPIPGIENATTQPSPAPLAK
jgi:hypothetical protein